MKNVFVFGGSGFIGTNLIDLLLKKNFKVFNIDMVGYASVPEIFKKYKKNKNYFFKKIDMAEYKKIENLYIRYKPSYIYNLAAMSHVDRSIDSPKKTLENNILSTLNLLEIIRINKNIKHFKRLIHLSTDEVYGDVFKPSKEKDTLNPSSPYSSSKASCDLLIKSYVRTFKIPSVIVRACNNFGPYQFTEKFIPTILTSFRQNKKIPVYGSGNQKREWIYVEDFCRILINFTTKGLNGSVYNVGSGMQISNIKLIKKIYKFLKLEKSLKKYIKHVKDRPGHDKSYSLNSSKSMRALKTYKINSFKKNLSYTINWYMSNLDWFDYTKKNYKGQRLGVAK